MGRRQDEKIHLDWQKGPAVFSWGIGQVQMPAGFTYQRELGIDTFVGRFNSKDAIWWLSMTLGTWRQNTEAWGISKR